MWAKICYKYSSGLIGINASLMLVGSLIPCGICLIVKPWNRAPVGELIQKAPVKSSESYLYIKIAVEKSRISNPSYNSAKM